MDNKSYNMEANEIKKWNWGAFLLSIPWAIGNRSYLALLTVIPFFGFIWMFVCGLKGNEWAWHNNQYRDIEEFSRVQETWNRAGLVMIIVYLVFILLSILFATFVASAAFVGFNSANYY